MTWDDRGNDRAAWERAFEHGEHWDEVDGDAITAVFAQVLIANLPADVTALVEAGADVLDWGCARGQMTAALRSRFPESRIAGLDFARNAVEQARARYGGAFIWEPMGKILDTWDVIVASNVLEHVLDPFALVVEHLARTRRYYVALSPYAEELGPGAGMTPAERRDAGHAHLHSFGSFPSELGGWPKIGEATVEVRGPWVGTQVVAAYASP